MKACTKRSPKTISGFGRFKLDVGATFNLDLPIDQGLELWWFSTSQVLVNAVCYTYRPMVLLAALQARVQGTGPEHVSFMGWLLKGCTVEGTLLLDRDDLESRMRQACSEPWVLRSN